MFEAPAAMHHKRLDAKLGKEFLILGAHFVIGDW